MSYNDRIEAAQAVINEHNEAIGGSSQPGYVDPAKLISCIKATGGTSEDRLAQLSHEDILACLPDIPTPTGGVKPRILAKAIAAVFRNKEEKESDPAERIDRRPVSAKKAERMTPRELVEAFDPEDFASPVGVRLKEISRGEPFVVYDSGRAVDVETTLKLLLEVKQGYKGREDMDVKGGVKKVYRLGELPENYADENPLYRGRPLRPDGTCDQTGRSWEGVPLEIRQLVRVAMDTGELAVSHEQAHNTLDLVMESDALAKLRKRYRKATVQFETLSKTGDLPTLKIELGVGEGGSPFPDGKRVVWAQNPGVPNAYQNKRPFGGTMSHHVNG